jgi:16S rRNA (uracil1498-N3)-methyltransferase
MSVRRFLVAAPPERGRTTLDPDVSKHAVKVLRLEAGDAVVLFDGRGTEWPGVIEKAARKGVVVAAGEARPSPRAPGPRLVLGTAVPKGKRMSTLLSMVTEAGVDLVVPVLFARSAVRGASDTKRDHWRRTVAEAARQCGRAWMPALEEEVPFREFVARPREEGERRFLPTTTGAPPSLLARASGAPVVVLLVGPEGGFTGEEEAEAAAAGFEPCTLGPSILRVETAAVAAVALARAGA